MKSKVSVLTAVYNGERYIKKAIDSILAQTYGNFEYIIVDNNSNDGTPSILEGYAKADKRINVIQEVNTGPASARNAGLNVAKGEWIAILDADDIAMPERLELQLNYVDEHRDVCLLGTGCIAIDEKGDIIKEHQYPATHNLLVRHLENRLAFFPHSSDLIRKEAIVKLNGYSTRFSPAEDYDLWLRLSTCGKLACINKPLIKLRQHWESLSHLESGRTQQLRAVASAVCHFRRKDGLSDPSQMEQEVWEEFLAWINNQMELRGIFKNLHKYQDVRNAWHNIQVNKMKRIMGVARRLIFEPQTHKAILSHYRKENFALILAEESRELWIS